MRKLNFQKTVLWVLIVVNCWKILLKCFASVSCFELTFVDPWIELNDWLVWYKTWNSVAELLKVQTALFLVLIQVMLTFLVSIIHWSFINYSTNQNETRAKLCGNSIEDYLHAPNFHTRMVLEHWLFINAWKNYLVKRNSVHFFFRFKSWIKTFSRPPPNFLLLCCHCSHDYNEILPKNSCISGKLWSPRIGFLLLCFWTQTSLPNFYRSVVKTFARTDFRTRVGSVKISFCRLEFCLGARTVLHINFSVNNRCLQPTFLMSS